ncbi:MAG: hypothetical protein ACKOW9_05055 [Candidatus Paceibacterota bacterium]
MDEELWERYYSEADDLGRILGKAAKPLAKTSAVKKSIDSASFRFLDSRLRLGGAFAGSMEIFVSMQLFTVIIGAGFLFVVLLQPLPWFFSVPLIGLSVILPIWPFNEVVKKAAEKSAIINEELPDFAELLAMVLPSMSVPQAVAFTTEHSEGLVSFEMRELIRTLSSRTLTENEAFDLTAARLGTDDGKRFVDALREAYTEGNRVVETISGQAETMRKVSFQRQRASVKKLPIKLTFIFALHFMPMLFALAFLPVVAGLAGAL